MADVVVIGAGLAGLVAADELERAGCEVVTLEARERVGGRVHSRELDNGAVVEMGAEFILPGNSAVRELAERLRLGLWDKGMRYGMREPRGGIGTTQEEIAAAVEAIDQALAAPGSSSGSAVDLLDSLEIEPGAREAILARVEISAASPAERVAASDLGGLAHIDEEPSPSIAGGNQRLAIGLSAELDGRVHLGTPVRKVAWGDEGVRVLTEEGEIEATACVVAVPASMVEKIEFRPALPEPHGSVLAEVAYGQAAKLFVPLRRPGAEPSAVMSVPERYWCWTATGDESLPQPVLNSFAGSMPALERLRVAEGPDAWLALLRALRPDLELDPGGALLSTWSDDPWVRGAYSLAGDPRRAEILSEPAGPLTFAGEHAGGRFNGLMEGAIRSGRAAAQGLLGDQGPVTQRK